MEDHLHMQQSRILNFERGCKLKEDATVREGLGDSASIERIVRDNQLPEDVNCNVAIVPGTWSDVDSSKYWNIIQRFNQLPSKFSKEEDYRRSSLQTLAKGFYFKKKDEKLIASLPLTSIKIEDVEEDVVEAEMDIYDILTTAAPLEISQNGYVYQLKHLCLTGKALKSINLHCHFGSLQSLDISDNEIESIEFLGVLPNLKYLIASKNAIQVFLMLRPYPIALSVADFSHNNISSFANLKEFWTLTKINLSHNQIEKLDNFPNFKHLHILILSNNQIATLHTLILPSLVILDLSYNRIENISGLEKCRSLRYLNIAGNIISNLTPLRYMIELIELNAAENNIQSMSDIEFLKTMIELTNLTIHSNPLANVGNSRIQLIYMLPQLLRLDNSDVTPKDVQSAKDVFNPSFKKISFLDQIDMIVTQASQHADTVFDRFRNFQKLPPILLLVGSPRSRRHRLAILLKEKFKEKICLGGLHMVPVVNKEFPRDLDIPISIDSFNEMKTKGEFLATAKVLGHSCGFASSQISRACAKGAVLVASVSLPTAITLRNLNFRPIIVLILPNDPPSFPDLDLKIATMIRANMEIEEQTQQEAEEQDDSSEQREHRLSFKAELSLIPLEKVSKKIQKFINEVVEIKNLNDEPEDEGQQEEEDAAALETILKQTRFKSDAEAKVIFAVATQSVDSMIDAESTFFPKAQQNSMSVKNDAASSGNAPTVDSTQVEVGDESVLEAEGDAWDDTGFNDNDDDSPLEVVGQNKEATPGKGGNINDPALQFKPSSDIDDEEEQPEPLHELRKPPYSLPEKMSRVERLASILIMQTDVALNRSLNIYELLMSLPFIDPKDIEEAEEALKNAEWKKKILQNRLCNEILNGDEARFLVLEKINALKESEAVNEMYPREKFIPPNFSVLQEPCPVTTFPIGHEEFIKNYKLLVVKEERLRHKEERLQKGLRGRFSLKTEDHPKMNESLQIQIKPSELNTVATTQSLDKINKSVIFRQTFWNEKDEENGKARCIIPANVFEKSGKPRDKPRQSEKANYYNDYQRGTLAYKGLNIPLTESLKLETVPTELPKKAPMPQDYEEFNGEAQPFFDENGEATDFISLYEAKGNMFNDDDMDEVEGEGATEMFEGDSEVDLEALEAASEAEEEGNEEDLDKPHKLKFNEKVQQRTISVGKYTRMESKGSLKDNVKFRLPHFFASKRDPVKRKVTGFHRKISNDDDDDDDERQDRDGNAEDDDDDDAYGEDFRQSFGTDNSFDDVNEEGEMEKGEEEIVEVEEDEGVNESARKKRGSNQTKRVSDAAHEPVKFAQSHDTLTPHRASYDPSSHKEELSKAVMTIREQYVIFHQENPGFFSTVLDSSDICESFHRLLEVAQECIDLGLNEAGIIRAHINSYGEYSKENEKHFLEHRYKELKAHSETWVKGLDKPSKVYTLRERSMEPFGEPFIEKKKPPSNILDPNIPRPRFNLRMEKLIKNAQRATNEKTKCAEISEKEDFKIPKSQVALTCSEIFKGKPKKRPSWQDEIAEYECKQRERARLQEETEVEKRKSLGFDDSSIWKEGRKSIKGDEEEIDLCFEEEQPTTSFRVAPPRSLHSDQPMWKSDLHWKPSYDRPYLDNNFTRNVNATDCNMTEKCGGKI